MDVRATQGELARWKRQAERYSPSLSEFVRSTMNRAKVRVVAVADPDHLAELKRQGNNLNQLMHAINSGFPIDAARVDAVLSSLQALYRREIERG